MPNAFIKINSSQWNYLQEKFARSKQDIHSELESLNEHHLTTMHPYSVEKQKPR